MGLFIHIALIIVVALIVAVMIVLPDSSNGWHWLAAVGVLIVAGIAAWRTLSAEAGKPSRTTLR